MEQPGQPLPRVACLEELDRGRCFLRFRAGVHQNEQMISFGLHARVAGERSHAYALMTIVALS